MTGNDTLTDAVGFRVGNADKIQDRRQEIQMVVERAGLERFGIKLRIVHDQRDVDHLLVDRVGLLAHAM
jgi:hypothetical protein